MTVHGQRAQEQMMQEGLQGLQAPIRGICIEPQFFPAQAWDTRIQHELFSLD